MKFEQLDQFFTFGFLKHISEWHNLCYKSNVCLIWNEYVGVLWITNIANVTEQADFHICCWSMWLIIVRSSIIHNFHKCAVTDVSVFISLMYAIVTPSSRLWYTSFYYEGVSVIKQPSAAGLWMYQLLVLTDGYQGHELCWNSYDELEKYIVAEQ